MDKLSIPEFEEGKETPTSDLFGDLVREVGNLSPSLVTPYNIRCRIVLLEEKLQKYKELELDEPAEMFPIKHIFTEGVYAREIFIPAGILVIGKIHRHEHLNFISKGSVTVVTEFGGVEHLTAPCTMVSPIGTKRVLIAHEDTTWTTIHLNPSEERDIDKIVAEISVESYEEVGLVDPMKVILADNPKEKCRDSQIEIQDRLEPLEGEEAEDWISDPIRRTP